MPKLIIDITLSKISDKKVSFNDPEATKDETQSPRITDDVYPTTTGIREAARQNSPRLTAFLLWDKKVQNRSKPLDKIVPDSKTTRVTLGKA